MKHIQEYDSFNEGFSRQPDLNKIRKALSQGKSVYAMHARFPASFKILDISKDGGFATVDYEDGKGSEEMAAMNIDPRSIKIEESTNGMNEAYKLGQGWSKDFDYIGMLEMGAKADVSMGEKKLQSLFDSFEDVNYHSEASPLSYAIDELKDGNKAEAKKLLKDFNANCKKTLEQLK